MLRLSFILLLSASLYAVPLLPVTRSYLNCRKLSDEIEMVDSGYCDGQLSEIWEQIQRCVVSYIFSTLDNALLIM